MLSMFGPLEPFVVNRILFAPAIKLADDDEKDHFAQPPVDTKARLAATVVPFTCSFNGRLVVAPFAYLNFSENEPAPVALTFHSTKSPDACTKSANPDPV